MIRLACVYCGEKLRAKDALQGKQAKCPVCGHVLRIRSTPAPETKVTEHHFGDITPTGTLEWEGRSDIEIIEQLDEKAILRHIKPKRSLSFMLPQYDDLTLFALSVTLLIIFAVEPKAWHELIKPILIAPHERIVILFILAAIGMVLSLFGVFFRCQKPESIKWPMLIFAVLITAGTGAYAGYLEFTTSRGWLMIFPAWNIITSATLLIMLYDGQFSPDCIVDKPASPFQILFILVTAGILVTACHYIFHLHWAIVYSICVGYIMHLRHTLEKVIEMHGSPAKAS